MVRPQRAWSAVFAATTLVSTLPLFATRYLPFTDLPEHVAAIATIERLLFGDARGYELALGTSQYLLYDFVGALLAHVIGDAVTANRLLLASVAVAWSLSFRAVLRAFGRDERLALFAPMVFWNRALALGFLPFIGGVPLALLGVALVKAQLDRPTTRRAGLLVALGVALFYTHVSAWMLAVALAVALTAVTTLPRPSLQQLASAILPLTPSCVCALAWWRHKALATAAGDEIFFRWPIEETVGAVPIWTFDVWKTHIDELCAAGWWLAFALVVLRARPSEKLERRPTLVVLTPFVVTALLYLTTPFGVGQAAYLSVRLAPLLVLLSVLPLRPREDRASALVFGLPVSMTVVAALTATYEIRRAPRDLVGNVDALLDRIEPGRSVAMLNFATRAGRLHYFPYVYLGAYHRVKSEAFVAYSFTRMAHWPVHYRENAAPPGTFSTFDPCSYRLREDGRFYDYVLVQGDTDPFADDPPGPAFVRELAAGRFTLYKRMGHETNPTAPDRGPCERTR